MSIIQRQRGLNVQRWIVYTPTITAATGTFTTVSATGRYWRIGMTVCFEMIITITTNGTAATAVRATLPINAPAFSYTFAGRETAVTGNELQGIVSGIGNVMAIRNYDNTYPGGDGRSISISGVYEGV